MLDVESETQHVKFWAATVAMDLSTVDILEQLLPKSDLRHLYWSWMLAIPLRARRVEY